MEYTPTTITTIGPAPLNINELPTLAGSEKQVAWANTIRAKAIILITEWMHDKLDTPTMLYPSTGAAPIVVARQVAAPVSSMTYVMYSDVRTRMYGSFRKF